jgi:tRNA A-37 threonylcarbamoyl transferase component Bud32
VTEPHEIAAALAGGRVPQGVEVLKESPVRHVVRAGELIVKHFRTGPSRAAREARALERASALGVPVPELVASGPGWLATRFVDARPAARGDLDAILSVVEPMHAAGMLHGDLHLGNILMRGTAPLLIDLQRSRFLPWLPGVLRRRELGFLAYSLGEPLPRRLRAASRWTRARAQRHWKSRTKRATRESSGFTAWEALGERGFRRRDTDPQALARAIERTAETEPFKREPDQLYRLNGWILKRHSSASEARRAWTAGHGLEMRGVATGRGLGWLGPWLLMEDAGETLIDWVERDFDSASAATRAELSAALGGLLAVLHRRGIYHADLKANNVCWAPGCEPKLLDYGRVHFGRRVARRRRIKNLAQLNAALPDSVPAALRDRALGYYAAECGFSGDLDRLRADVVAESLTRRHRWSGC